jgi:hypothetical protein
MSDFFSFLDPLTNLFGTYIKKAVPKQPVRSVTVIRHRTRDYPVLRRAGSRIMVQRNPRPYWEENGWTKKGCVYSGEYRSRHGARSPGHITVSPGGRIEVFISNPPTRLQRHPHWHCFIKRHGDLYFIHPQTPVTDVSAAILSVEKTLNEAYDN